MPKNCKISCIVQGCTTVGMLYNDHFHKTKKRWLARIGRMDLDELSETEIYMRRLRVCSRHFTDRAYTSTLRTGLISQAEPELYLPDPSGPDSDGKLKLIHLPLSFSDDTTEGNVLGTVGTVLADNQSSSTKPPAAAAVKEESMAIMSVATVYSGSEDEGRHVTAAEAEDSNEDLENISLDKRLAPSKVNDDETVAPVAKRAKKSTKSNQEIPSYMKVINSKVPDNLDQEGLRQEIIKKDQLIKTLEKCLIEKSLMIQRLKTENVELKKQISS